MTEEINKTSHFIREAVAEDLASGRFSSIATRFPPEPNGYLHIGHARAIIIDFSIAEENGGFCNLRFDDTNPTKEDVEYVDAIKEDIRWLGYEWKNEFYASDYFDQLYEYAIELIKKGKAYVDEQTQDEVRKNRGSLTKPGVNSPYRDRPIEENLELFKAMKEGEFADGSVVLRTRIDMESGNMNMRDPVLYRILHNPPHHRTGDKWCIYPMYDFAHGQSDSIERITHSLCSLEYEDHRPLYEWFLEELGIFKTRQIEFARLGLTYTVMSKRRLVKLVKEGLVKGWDDPRMPTLTAYRRRGYTPEAIRAFVEATGVAKKNSTADVGLLEHHIRQDLNKRAERRMAVLDPLKVVITNYPEGQTEILEATNNPEDESAGTRQIPFSREFYIEKSDFSEDPPNKYFRLAPGREVRLRYGYFVTATDFVKDESGEVTEVHCTYDPETKGGYAPDGRKVRGTIHWISAEDAIDAEVRIYDRLFTVPNPMSAEEGKDFTDYLNADSLETVKGCKLEPGLKGARPGDRFQFERLGYFVVDPDTTDGNLIFNRTVTLRDTWARIEKARASEKMEENRRRKQEQKRKQKEAAKKAG
ncbi:MAG: glutamine--tRNA ligase/YqeY domain fusion protein [Anaerolineales bacterium]|uniref:Glutamine--tRNA ligase n=1 Tax=Candidatus Desulfolinea nitratireducens TaxID=2841698 RepID=A0A8J6TIY8_9CHLR|nr:glutamine--tRNA ligase/YqeY domain fusion protein [Candidatus Desulfolinea nitratireducens]MBL6960113.1 glutamine--tRNA ligase/YqeY domain fusion protein [Anaerolineales bacterium]